MKNGSWELGDFAPGAHLRVKVNHFYHHGIYIGNGEVVQFGLPFSASENPADIRVLRSPIADFCGGQEFVEVYRYSSAEARRKFSDEKIVENALSRVGEGGYEIVSNNCEHFCNECIFGKKSSAQIDEARRAVEALLNRKK